MDQEGKEFLFFGLHFAALRRRALVIVAHKVEDAVNHQEKNLFFCLPASRRGLVSGCFRRDDYIPQNLGVDGAALPGGHGKRDDIGGTVAVKILAVQPGDLFIVHDDDADFIFLTSQGA